jgi:hypothetical protein
VIKTVIGIKERNFQTIQGRNISGKNATSVVDVQLISGDLKSRTANIIADFLENQSLIFSDAHSTITITVSIAIHKVKTNEKLVKKFILSPK